MEANHVDALAEAMRQGSGRQAPGVECWVAVALLFDPGMCYNVWQSRRAWEEAKHATRPAYSRSA